MSGPRLLVVEDDAEIRRLLEVQLASYALTFATCRGEAERLLAERGFDAVLLDLRLPEQPSGLDASDGAGLAILDGIRAARRRRPGSAQPLPVVVMTAHGDHYAVPVSVLVEHGANDYLAKPFRKAELLAKLERALAGTGALVPAQGSPPGDAPLAPGHALTVVRLAFEPTQVRIESLPPLRGAPFLLLDALRPSFEEDLRRGVPLAEFRRLSGEALAKTLRVNTSALRRRVLRLRATLREESAGRLGAPLDDEAVVESARWAGYRLNPLTVRLVAPESLPQG